MKRKKIMKGLALTLVASTVLSIPYAPMVHAAERERAMI